MRLNAFEQIVFMKGEPPIRAWMLPYDRNKAMVKRLRPIPQLAHPPKSAVKPTVELKPRGPVQTPIRDPSDIEF